MTNFPYTLYNKKVEVSSLVNFHIFDEKGAYMMGAEKIGCFAGITYSHLSEKAKIIRVFFDLDKIPYSLEIIQEWIKTIDELGFPCKLSYNKTVAFFDIPLTKYKKKKHVASTLQLIRCLFEVRICHVPEIYFTLLKQKGDNLTLDEKFILLQKAHFELDNFEESVMFNANHTITSARNCPKKIGISRQTYFNRLDKDNYLVYDAHNYNNSVCGMWQEETEKQTTKI